MARRASRVHRQCEAPLPSGRDEKDVLKRLILRGVFVIDPDDRPIGFLRSLENVGVESVVSTRPGIPRGDRALSATHPESGCEMEAGGTEVQRRRSAAS